MAALPGLRVDTAVHVYRYESMGPNYAQGSVERQIISGEYARSKPGTLADRLREGWHNPAQQRSFAGQSAVDLILDRRLPSTGPCQQSAHYPYQQTCSNTPHFRNDYTRRREDPGPDLCAYDESHTCSLQLYTTTLRISIPWISPTCFSSPLPSRPPPTSSSPLSVKGNSPSRNSKPPRLVIVFDRCSLPNAGRESGSASSRARSEFEGE